MIFDADTNLWYGQVKAEKFDFELIYNDYIVNVNILDTIIFFGDNNNSYEGLNIICVYDTPNPYIAHKLINPNSIRDMQVMLIDGKQVELFPIKIFNEIGEHTVSFMFNQYNNSNSLDRMTLHDTSRLSNLFTSCHFLKEVTFKNNIILPEYSSMYETFYDCINLQKVIFEEGFDSTNLYYMERTFYKCGMKEYNVIGLDTSNVISYYECFRNSKIEYMDFRKIQFNKEATSSYMFQDSSLNHIYISNEMGDLNTGNTYNMFYGLSEEGICEYNCNYDVSKVISIIPQTWNIECIPVNVTIKLILIKEGEVITELTENEILTITDNKISGSYDLEQGCWIFNYMAYDVFDDVYLNDTYIGYVSNQKTVKQYAFIGDCSSYTGYSFQSTFVTTTDSEYVIFNKSQQKNMISVILDGYPIKGNIAYIYTNLYNDVDYIATFTNGKAINNDGSEISVSGYELSDYIPISNSTTIMWHNGDQSGYSKLIEYDENKNVLDYWTCNNATRTITLGGNTNTKYMRIALKTSVKDNVYLIDETNQKYLFRGNDVEIKGVNENIGETHTVQYIFDVEENNSMANLFDGCSGLTYIQFNENFDTSNVEYMNSLFYNCKGLKDLNITSLKTDNAKAISSMFAMCSGLTTIDVSHFNTEKCDNISDMFPYTNVETLDLSNFKTSNVTKLSMMFRNNTNLKTIIGLDKWDMSNVLRINDMFSNCKKLTDVTIYSSLDNVSDYANMFSGVTTDGVLNYNIIHEEKILDMFVTNQKVSNFPTSWRLNPVTLEKTYVLTLITNDAYVKNATVSLNNVVGVYNESDYTYTFENVQVTSRQLPLIVDGIEVSQVDESKLVQYVYYGTNDELYTLIDFTTPTFDTSVIIENDATYPWVYNEELGFLTSTMHEHNVVTYVTINSGIIGDATITLYQKNESESNYDYSAIFNSSNEIIYNLQNINSDNIVINVNTEDGILKFGYQKDYSYSEGTDCLGIKKIEGTKLPME